jgi:hypothetical protein
MNNAMRFFSNKLFFVGLAMLVFSCSDHVDETDETHGSVEQTFDFEEETIRAFVMDKLQLKPEDIGSFEMKRAHLNADSIQDGFVFLNLAPKAMRDMETSSNPARFQDAGYIGDYNYIFVWDGATQKMGTAFKLVGNGLVPIEVSLIQLLDPGYKTLTARYRVQNSIFETYFQNVGGSLVPVFSYLVVDQMGSKAMTMYYHAVEENPSQLEKDIVIYGGVCPTYNADEAARDKNTYAIGPIQSDGQEIYRFFYDPKSGKYATNAPLPE